MLVSTMSTMARERLNPTLLLRYWSVTIHCLTHAHQVAAGQTNGGLLTYVDYGHGTGHRPIVAAPAVSYALPHVSYAAPHVYYGKRDADAEPYTLAQVWLML